MWHYPPPYPEVTIEEVPVPEWVPYPTYSWWLKFCCQFGTYLETSLHIVGVATDPAYQSRGLSSACAAMMVGELFAAGRQPVWSVFLSNTPSLRISEKLQFVTQTQCTAIRRRPED